MGKGLRKAIPPTTTPLETRKLGRVIIDLGKRREVVSMGENHHPMIALDELSLFTLMFFLKHRSIQ